MRNSLSVQVLMFDSLVMENYTAVVNTASARGFAKYLKKFWTGWNWFEFFCLFLALAVVPGVGIVFGSSVPAVIGSVGMSVGTILYAKGKIEGFFFTLGFVVFELVVAFQVQLYSTVIVIICFVYPVTVISIVSWWKKRRVDASKGKVVVVNKVKPREYFMVAMIVPFLVVGNYFMLDALASRLVEVTSITLALSMIANYFLFRRSNICFVLWFLLDLLGFVIWTLVLLDGEVSAISMMALVFMYFITDAYGIVEWNRLRKKQSAEILAETGVK